MDWLNVFYVLVGFVTIFSLVYAFLVARRSERRKILACDISPSVSLITIVPDRAGHRFSIIYEKEGTAPSNINGAHTQFVRIANLGKEPIRREDLATSDALQLEIHGAKVLDIAVASVSRQVINFELGPLDETDTISVANPSFDFLDYQDGAVIQLLTDSPASKVVLHGTVIGMPAGISQVNELVGSGSRRLLRLLIVTTVSMLIMAGPTFMLFGVPRDSSEGFAVQSNVSKLWLTAVMLSSFAIAFTFMHFTFRWIMASDRRWPARLDFPDWFVSRYQADRLGFK
jgi:hypothetical protein